MGREISLTADGDAERQVEVGVAGLQEHDHRSSRQPPRLSSGAGGRTVSANKAAAARTVEHARPNRPDPEPASGRDHAMRMMLRLQMDNQAASRAIQDGSLPTIM